LVVTSEKIWTGISSKAADTRWFLPDGWLKHRYYRQMLKITNKYIANASRGLSLKEQIIKASEMFHDGWLKQNDQINEEEVQGDQKFLVNLSSKVENDVFNDLAEGQDINQVLERISKSKEMTKLLSRQGNLPVRRLAD
jgi:hypothetical protein